MKTYYLLWLRWGANKVIAEITAISKADAISYFNFLVKDVKLDNDGYFKPAEHPEVTFTVAERF